LGKDRKNMSANQVAFFIGIGVKVLKKEVRRI